MLRSKKQILGLILTALIAVVFMMAAGVLLRMGKKDVPNEKYVLKKYENTVALYKGDIVIEVYGNIVLNNLPEQDRSRLTSGIEFNDRLSAEKALEDYDG